MTTIDCGAIKPDEECGECEACIEAEADGIDRAVETGSMSEAEARDAHMANGTWPTQLPDSEQ